MNDFVVESGASARARSRRRRAAATLAVVVLVLFGAFWYAYSYFRNPPPTASTPTATCTTAKPAPPVTVNVYNATDRQGLAASTADALKKRGFVIGTVANDPLHKTVKATAEVRYGKAGALLAPRVLRVVTSPAKVQDKRTDKSIDLVLGDGFKTLTAVPRSVPTKTCS